MISRSPAAEQEKHEGSDQLSRRHSLPQQPQQQPQPARAAAHRRSMPASAWKGPHTSTCIPMGSLRTLPEAQHMWMGPAVLLWLCTAGSRDPWLPAAVQGMRRGHVLCCAAPFIPALTPGLRAGAAQTVHGHHAFTQLGGSCGTMDVLQGPFAKLLTWKEPVRLGLHPVEDTGMCRAAASAPSWLQSCAGRTGTELSPTALAQASAGKGRYKFVSATEK